MVHLLKLIQCLIHLITCHTHEGVSCVYANILALVKLGVFTTVCYNYTKYDPSLFPGEMLPDGFIDIFEKTYLPGYNNQVFIESQKKIVQAIVEPALDDTPFKEFIVSDNTLGLEELETNADDNRISIRNMNESKGKGLACIGLGVLVLVCIATGVLSDWNSIL